MVQLELSHRPGAKYDFALSRDSDLESADRVTAFQSDGSALRQRAAALRRQPPRPRQSPGDPSAWVASPPGDLRHTSA